MIKQIVCAFCAFSWRPSRADGGGTNPPKVPGYLRRLPPAPSNAQSPDKKCHAYLFCSFSKSFLFLSNPQRYPPRLLSSRTTRWQGITSATGFVAQARPTARTAPGLPNALATSPYETVSPYGIARSFSQT